MVSLDSGKTAGCNGIAADAPAGSCPQFQGDWASKGTLNTLSAATVTTTLGACAARAIPGAAVAAGKPGTSGAPAGACPQFNGDWASKGTLNTLAATWPARALCNAWALVVAACAWIEPAANSNTIATVDRLVSMRREP